MTFIVAGILGLFFVLISAQVIKKRRQKQIPYGWDNDRELASLVSAHSNFAGYVPFLVLLLYLTEFNTSAPNWWVGLLATIILLGRISHFVGLSMREKHGDFRFRVMGMVFTLFPLVMMSLFLIAWGLNRQFNWF